MREVEISTQHLIADGFDIGTAHDPYKNFVYTSIIIHTIIGKNSTIGGNVWLTASVPENSIVYQITDTKLKTKTDHADK